MGLLSDRKRYVYMVCAKKEGFKEWQSWRGKDFTFGTGHQERSASRGILGMAILWDLVDPGGSP